MHSGGQCTTLNDMHIRHVAILSIVLALLNPAPVRAQGVFTAFLGASNDGDTSSTTYGLALGALAGGVFGFEIDLGFTPDFLGDEFEDSNLVTIMGNLALAIPLPVIQPYASGGIGLVRSSVSGPGDLLDISSNDFGIDVGAGLRGFFNDTVGVAGDFRYFRRVDEGSDLLDFDLGTFDFWRVTGGVTFRF